MSHKDCPHFWSRFACHKTDPRPALHRLSKGLLLLFACWSLLSPNLVLGQEIIDLGGWTPQKIDRLLAEAGQISDPGLRSRFLSAAFLETPYLPATLIGSTATAEVFVIRLDAIDCFTLLDYVEALRRSGTFDEFKQTLRSVRYQAGQVDFMHRNHFFSEWARANNPSIQNVTELVAGLNARTVVKHLNQKGAGKYYLPGYPVKRREISYIPPDAVDKSLLARLKDGDYIGIYSPLPGLDVSHCGIVFKKNGKIFLRHASSRSTLKKVVDQELLPYLAGKKGLIIYRPVDK